MNIELTKIKPSKVLDIGANIGQFYQEHSKIWPDAEFFLIEGNPDCEVNLQKFSVPYKIALLSDKEQLVNFYICPDSSVATGASYYKELTHYYENPITKQMKTTTLDSLFTNNEKFDLIKIDVQGAEHDVIRGGMNIISGCSYIIMEVGVAPYNENAPLWYDTMQFMKGIGFNKFTELKDLWHPIEKHIIQKDVLFYR